MSSLVRESLSFKEIRPSEGTVFFSVGKNFGDGDAGRLLMVEEVSPGAGLK